MAKIRMISLAVKANSMTDGGKSLISVCVCV